MRLPPEFTARMRQLLGDEEFRNFMESYNAPRYFGLRVNTLKVGVKEFTDISPFHLESVPWTSDGFYYSACDTPGRHPYYHAGLYYIQEPSAMLPAEILGAQPGERVLDLCAAPGGKTVRIAAGMKGKGLLVANDINRDRVKALVKNIELCGVRNAVVTNEPPEKLARRFQGYFDRILADAPCSGEGMFRKDGEASKSWERYKCGRCAAMQRDILESAHVMLKPGGVLAYSTCTFSPEENEKVIASFIERHSDYELLDIPKTGGMEGGRPEWAGGGSDLAKTVRLWPHRVKGEGHFAALLKKNGERIPAAGEAPEECIEDSGIPMAVFRRFEEKNLNTSIKGCFNMKGANLYNLPVRLPDLSGIRTAKFGWYLGEFRNDRFEPSHSMLTALKRKDIRNTIDFGAGSSEVISYLKGETLMIEGEKGLTGICVDGYTVGWAKQAGDALKNLYPKGWRRMG